MALERSVKFGGHHIKFPSQELQELGDSNSIVGNKDLLWRELNDKGGMHHEGFTGAHVDMVYMGRGTKNLCTMWTPFGDVDVQMGTLAVCEGSNRLPGFEYFQKTYGNLDCEKENLKGTGWFTTDPFEITSKFGGQWKTTDFMAGDVLIFNMRTVHMSTTNTSDFVRISCDTRWQPVSEPVDMRYIGDFKSQNSKFGVYGRDRKDVVEKEGVTMEELREKWGLQ